MRPCKTHQASQMQKIICCISQNNTRFTGSFENEDPNLESELSTQNSETEHPRLENDQDSKMKHPNLETTVGWGTTT